MLAIIHAVDATASASTGGHVGLPQIHAYLNHEMRTSEHVSEHYLWKGSLLSCIVIYTRLGSMASVSEPFSVLQVISYMNHAQLRLNIERIRGCKCSTAVNCNGVREGVSAMHCQHADASSSAYATSTMHSTMVGAPFWNARDSHGIQFLRQQALA